MKVVFFALNLEEVGGQRESQGAKAFIFIRAFALQGEYTNYLVHRVLPYAKCFWALAFPSAADLFDVQPACHVIADNHLS